MNNKLKKRIIAICISALMILSAASCSGGMNEASDTSLSEASETSTSTATDYLSKEDITVNETFENSADGEHAIEVSGEEKEYSNIGVTKTGDASGDEADFYGENSAVFATEKGTLTIKDSLIETNGSHANAVFSYGEGTTVNISDSVIETKGNCSGGQPPEPPSGDAPGGQAGSAPPEKPGDNSQESSGNAV